MEFSKLNSIIEKWDITRITSSQLKLEKTIASGGQGKVKIGRYYSMFVIVKILHKINTNNFTSEMLNAYKYRHPSIPKFLGVFESEKHYGLVMEYIDGITLTKLIQLEKGDKIHITLLQKIDYLIQLCCIIEFLHSNNLIHRDLKTDNIMIDYFGNLKLIDFGIALQGKEKWINMESSDYSLTPSYMAPEIAFQAQEDDEEEEEENEEEENEEEEYIKPKKFTSNKNINNKLIENNFRKRTLSYNYSNINIKNIDYCDNGKWILITNKYDIWTFGLIMAYLFTRCKPWCRNEKEDLSDMEVQIRLMSHLPYPLYNIYPLDECLELKDKIKEIILKCLEFEPEKRVNIQDIKILLLDIYNLEVKHKTRLDKLIKMQKIHKDNAKINEILKSLNDDKKKNIIRNNKILIRKNLSLEEINQINFDENNNKKLKEGFELLKDKINKNKTQNSFHTNTLLEHLKFVNISREQKLLINKSIIQELENLNNKN